MPRLLIIQAATYHSPDQRRPLRIKKRKMVGAVMPYLAAMAPKDWQVTVRDDAIEGIAIDAVIAYEQARGCEVESVESDNRGFDLISRPVNANIVHPRRLSSRRCRRSRCH